MSIDLRRATPLPYGSGRADRPWMVQVESARGGNPREVSATWTQHRIASQYEAARKRQGEAEAARKNYTPPPKEPPLDALEPQDRLTPRQELFCQYYAAQPVATRAAMLAGYSERSAGSKGWKLLRHPLVLDRIAQLRAQRRLSYRVERDTMHDKLETVYFEAVEAGSHAAAVAALRLQALLGGLIAPRASAVPRRGAGDATGDKGKDPGPKQASPGEESAADAAERVQKG
jgi:hypothetical protein